MNHYQKYSFFFSRTQLLQYNSIRRASLNLRHLSRNRDTPLLSAQHDRDYRTVSLNFDGEQGYRRTGHGTASAPGTLQRYVIIILLLIIIIVVFSIIISTSSSSSPPPPPPPPPPLPHSPCMHFTVIKMLKNHS